QAPSPAITWTVINQGANAAVGSWYDSVYLSVDGIWDISDLLIARVQHSGDVAAGASYTGSTTAALPAVIPGGYHVIVRADTRNNVRETDDSNNTGASAAAMAMDMSALPLGVTVLGTIADGQDVYFRLNALAGQDLLFTLNFTESAQGELYLRYGQPPTRGQFDAVYDNLYDLQQQLTVSGAKQGSYYVLLHGRQGAGAGAAFDITAEDLTFEVQSVGPDHGSNLGQATLTISGSRFTVDAIPTLLASDGTERPASRTWWKDANTLWATFDLTGLATGLYDIRIEAGGQTATSEDAFTVTDGAPGEVQVHMVVPGTLRPGQQGVVTVDYFNAGDTDVPAPLLVLEAENADLRLPGQTDFAGSSVQFLGINTDGPAGILPPGSSGRISINFRPTVSSGSVDFSLGMMPVSDETFDWSAVKNDMRPESIAGDAWDAIWANFTAAVGNTLDDYQAVLSDNANYLSQLGEYVYDVGRLLAFEFAQAADSLHFRTLASSVDVYWTAPGLNLTLTRVFAQPISGRFALGPLGRGWSHNWQFTVETELDSDVIIRGPGGTMRLFSANGDRTFRPSPGDYGVLTLDQGLYRLTETDGTAFAFRYDGRLGYVQDTNGNRITCVYTGDRLTSLLHSNGDSLTLTYNAQGQLTQLVDPAGRITTYAYDAASEHLLTVTGPDGTTSYAYSAQTDGPRAHTIESIAYPGGTHDYFEYDDNGRLIRTWRDGGAEEVTYAYDSAAGFYVTDATVATATLLYDDYGQVSQVHDPLHRSVIFAYDDSHNLTGLALPGGITYSYQYDRGGNLVRQLDPLGHSVELAYREAFDRLESVTDQRGNVTSYGYDAWGNLTSITYQDGTVESYVYDDAGNVTAWTNRRGQVVSYTYDADGRLASKDDSGTVGVVDYEYVYDARGNLISAAGPEGATSMTYDAVTDWLIRIDYPGGQFFLYQYNAAGQRSTRTDQGGNIVSYSYDAVGRLDVMTDTSGAVIVDYDYDAAGRLVLKTLGNDVYTAYDYDAAGQLISLINYAADDSVLSHFDYAYDALGRRVEMNTQYGMWTYQYDATGQLTRAVLDSIDPGIPDQDLLYVYDAAGNRIRTISNGVTAEYTTNGVNQYTDVGGVTYTYDDDGNLVSKTEGGVTTTYTYNTENHLVRVETPTDVWAYTYDALGERIASTHNGEPINYVVDPIGFGDVAAEYDGEGNLIVRYDHGFGLISQTDALGNSAYYTFDALGSTSELTDEAGVVLNNYAYTPFGSVLGQFESVANTFQFVGEYGVMNESNGLEFMRARFFDPFAGRFVTSDPLRIPGPNNYAYAVNNPLSFVDPIGLSNWVAEGAKETLKDLQGLLEAGGLYDLPFDLEGLADLAELAGRQIGDPGSVDWDELAEAAKKTLPGLGDLAELAGRQLGDPGSVDWDELAEAAEKTLDSRGLGHLADLVKELAEQVGSHWDQWMDWLRGLTGIVAPRDPNDKVGPNGFGEVQFVGADLALQHTINFENVADATAPAQVVTVTDQLDDDLDWRTLRLGEIAFGSYVITVPDGRSFYTTTVDLRPDGTDLLVRIDAGLDPATGMVTWTFASIDPDTGEAPTEALVGFLPPNDGAGSGQGHVTYTVRPKADRTTGTVVTNAATIVFDTQEPIETNVTSNVIDAAAPSSAVAPLAPSQTDAAFTVSWSGADDAEGSGLAAYDVYVARDGGPFEIWLAGTTDGCAMFTADPAGHTYAFYTRAHDHVGNLEAAPAVPDAVTATPDLLAPTVTAAQVNDGLTQRSKIGRLAFTFSEHVAVAADDLLLHNDTTNQDITLPAGIFSYDADARTVTWDLSGIDLAEGYYTATLSATGIVDGAGNVLAGDREKAFHVLKCDANGDAKVDGGDLAVWQDNYDPLGLNENTPGMGDWNGDGKIDGGDLALWQQRYNPIGLPAPLKAGAKLAVTEAEPIMTEVQATSVAEPTTASSLPSTNVSVRASGLEPAGISDVLDDGFLCPSNPGDAGTDTQPPAGLEVTLPKAEGSAMSAAPMAESTTQADDLGTDQAPSEPVPLPSASEDHSSPGEPNQGLDDGLEDILSLAELILPLGG
ncbi:MAG TPA: RHS repeat-associated core domain-containing protein, partial [Phycisphaerae bacterium]|nr:RHS repeat-associated core domain-containing protein [Phycisphaerae bacterium]